MQFRLNRHKALLGELQFLHLQLLADEFLTPKFGEVRLREKYFKRVYERMAVE